MKVTDIFEYKGILVSLECTQQGAEENFVARCSFYFEDEKTEHSLLGETNLDSWKALIKEYIDGVLK